MGKVFKCEMEYMRFQMKQETFQLRRSLVQVNHSLDLTNHRPSVWGTAFVKTLDILLTTNL